MDKASIENFKKMWEASQILFNRDPSEPPKIIVGGKTGVGKSSLLNALLQRNVYEIGVLPTTRVNKEHIWNSPDKNIDIVVIDAPGFGEAEKITSDNKDEYMQNINSIAELQANIMLLVLKCDDRALSLEDTFIKHFYNDRVLKNIPLIACVNQIDKMKPVRDWAPSNLNLMTPRTEKEKNIRKYLDYVQGIASYDEQGVENVLKLSGSFGNIDKQNFIPVCSGESFDEVNMQYGLDKLKERIYEVLPESTKTIYARALKESDLIKKEAENIIYKYSGLCSAAVLANFIPASDSLVLVPLQIAMIKKLGDLYGITMTSSTIQGILSAVGMSFAGRAACSFIISWFPGVKNLVGPPLAFTLTYSMGKVINELLAKGITVPGPDVIKDLSDKYQNIKQPSAEEIKGFEKKYKDDIKDIVDLN